MKTTAAILALVGGVFAQEYLYVLSVRSASPIQYQPFTASGFKIFLGGTTAAYCPEQVGSACPAGNVTTVVYGNGGLGMGAEVPGGQQVYIDSCTGALGYTQAHSASYPEGAILDGWSVIAQVAASGSLGELNWENGLIACPDSETGRYQVFAQVDGVDFQDDCLGFDALFSNGTEPTAWQYT